VGSVARRHDVGPLGTATPDDPVSCLDLSMSVSKTQNGWQIEIRSSESAM